MRINLTERLQPRTLPLTPKHSRTPLFYSSISGPCCWQLVVIWLCTGVPDSQDAIGRSGRREKHGGSLSSWKCFPYVDVFSVTLFFLRRANWTEHDPTCCANNTPCHVSFVPGSHNKHKDTLQFGAQRSSHVPVCCPGHRSNSASPPLAET